MSYRYSTALSHLVLAGTGIYCLSQTGFNTFNQTSFGLITINSIIGVWRWGNPDYGAKADSIYRLTSFLQKIFTLSCITTSIWLGYNYMQEMVFLHLLPPFVTLVYYLFQGKEKAKLIELITAINCISLLTISYFFKNYYGLALVVSAVLNCLILREHGNVPPQDLYNYGMCFFAVFALKTIAGTNCSLD